MSLPASLPPPPLTFSLLHTPCLVLPPCLSFLYIFLVVRRLSFVPFFSVSILSLDVSFLVSLLFFILFLGILQVFLSFFLSFFLSVLCWLLSFISHSVASFLSYLLSSSNIFFLVYIQASFLLFSAPSYRSFPPVLLSFFLFIWSFRTPSIACLLSLCRLSLFMPYSTPCLHLAFSCHSPRSLNSSSPFSHQFLDFTINSFPPGPHFSVCLSKCPQKPKYSSRVST